ncbi:hypothetical protein [Alkalihalobacillus sp. CinArs1]|uniref:hypothetical protein n=1 Tax=Alkalihalobacillus sp. CinArs1 TaxID=2995314 RepID=UPI0022DDB91A|nr:hypothetical protein [Alkalihalobacillus sp. CinArs1]
MPLLFLLIALLTMFSFGFMISPIFFLVAIASAIYYSNKRKYMFASVVTFIVSLLVLITMGLLFLVVTFGQT